MRRQQVGDALFHVYQGRNFAGLTTLMASQQFQRLGPHADEAEATRGGLLLAYGLHREAETVFTALAERGATPGNRRPASIVTTGAAGSSTSSVAVTVVSVGP